MKVFRLQRFLILLSIAGCQTDSALPRTAANAVTRAPTSVQQLSLPRIRSDVRAACQQVAIMATASSARSVSVLDTLVDSTQYHPRQTGCRVFADSFATAQRA